MALLDQDMYQLAGLLSNMPTFSGRPNPMNRLTPAFFQMGQQARGEAQKQKKQQALQNMLLGQSVPQEGPTMPGQTLPDIQQGGLISDPGQAQLYQGLLDAGYGDQVVSGLLSQGGGKYESVKIDDLGRAWGIKDGQFELIPSQGQFTKYKTVQGTGEGGMPQTELVNPALLGDNQGRITIGGKALPAETAAKKAMLDTAIEGLRVAEPILFNKDGGVNKEVIKEMWAIDLAGPAAAFVSSDAGKLFNTFELSTQAITRTETGAAMPPEEVQNTKKRFMPKPWDSDEVVQQKWLMLNVFLQNADKYLDPTAAKSGKWNSVLKWDQLKQDISSGDWVEQN